MGEQIELINHWQMQTRARSYVGHRRR